MASVHEKRNRITWIECEYSHYYLQILSLKCILSHKRKPSESKEYYTEELSHHNYTNSHSNSTQVTQPSFTSKSRTTSTNMPEPPSFPSVASFVLNQSSTPIPTAIANIPGVGLPPSPISTQSNPSTPITPSLSSASKRHQNGHNHKSNPVIRITPISIDMYQYLIVSRLIFANQKDMDTIRDVFAEEYDLESRKLYHANQWHNINADDYGATKYRGVVRKKSDSLTRNDNGTKYILDNFFGINPSKIKLLFNRNGDKILFQSMGEMLHHSYGQTLSHGDQYSGHLNDFGALHVIDVTTGNSIWSLGSSSKDIGYGWFNEFLMVLPSINSASGLASSDSIYDPNKKSRSLSMSAMHHSISSRQTHKSSVVYQPRRKHSHLQLLGFLSETSIAEAIYHNCNNIEYLNKFSWDLCVLTALYCGGMREYRQLSLAKYETKQKMNGHHKKKNGKNNGKNGTKSKYTISDLKLLSNDILSIWNVNDNYYNLQLLERRNWLIIAIKSFRDTMRFIDIMFYDAKRIGMYDEDIFIPYNDNDGLICRNLLGDSNKFDSLYY